MKKREIEVNLNSDNILSKRVKRTRQSKKQIYAVHLDNDSHEGLLTFYESFSSLLLTRNYYFSVDFSASSPAALAAAAINQSSIAKSSISSGRLHRDILLSRGWYEWVCDLDAGPANDERVMKKANASRNEMTTSHSTKQSIKHLIDKKWKRMINDFFLSMMNSRLTSCW